MAAGAARIRVTFTVDADGLSRFQRVNKAQALKPALK
jgi:hypothetical protein